MVWRKWSVEGSVHAFKWYKIILAQHYSYFKICMKWISLGLFPKVLWMLHTYPLQSKSHLQTRSLRIVFESPVKLFKFSPVKLHLFLFVLSNCILSFSRVDFSDFHNNLNHFRWKLYQILLNYLHECNTHLGQVGLLVLKLYPKEINLM